MVICSTVVSPGVVKASPNPELVVSNCQGQNVAAADATQSRPGSTTTGVRPLSEESGVSADIKRAVSRHRDAPHNVRNSRPTIAGQPVPARAIPIANLLDRGVPAGGRKVAAHVHPASPGRECIDRAPDAIVRLSAQRRPTSRRTCERIPSSYALYDLVLSVDVDRGECTAGVKKTAVERQGLDQSVANSLVEL